jgi:hypothetical protein
VFGIGRRARHGKSDTTARATTLGRSSSCLRSRPRRPCRGGESRGADPARLSRHWADPEVRNRVLPLVSANSCQPWQSLTRVERTRVYGRSRTSTKSLQTPTIRSVQPWRPKHGRGETRGRRMDGSHRSRSRSPTINRSSSTGDNGTTSLLGSSFIFRRLRTRRHVGAVAPRYGVREGLSQDCESVGNGAPAGGWLREPTQARRQLVTRPQPL